MLRLVEIQTHPSSHLVHHAFATSWSENNQIALMTEKGVQILELHFNPHNKTSSIDCLRATIDTSEAAPTSSVLIDTEAMLHKSALQEASTLVKNTDWAPNLVKTLPIPKVIVQTVWSPRGVLHYGRCLLACLTNVGQLTLFTSEQGGDWLPKFDVSLVWLRYSRKKWSKPNRFANIKHQITELQYRANRIKYTAVAWERFSGDEFSCSTLLITASQDGIICLWIVEDENYKSSLNLEPITMAVTNGLKVKLVKVFDSKLTNISSLLWCNIDSLSGVLIVGNIRGLINSVCVKFCDMLKNDEEDVRNDEENVGNDEENVKNSEGLGGEVRNDEGNVKNSEGLGGEVRNDEGIVKNDGENVKNTEGLGGEVRNDEGNVKNSEGLGGEVRNDEGIVKNDGENVKNDGENVKNSEGLGKEVRNDEVCGENREIVSRVQEVEEVVQKSKAQTEKFSGETTDIVENNVQLVKICEETTQPVIEDPSKNQNLVSEQVPNPTPEQDANVSSEQGPNLTSVSNPNQTQQPNLTCVSNSKDTQQPIATSVSNPKQTQQPNLTCVSNPKETQQPNLTCVSNPNQTQQPNLTCVSNSKDTQQSNATSVSNPKQTQQPNLTCVSNPKETQQPNPTPVSNPNQTQQPNLTCVSNSKDTQQPIATSVSNPKQTQQPNSTCVSNPKVAQKPNLTPVSNINLTSKSNPPGGNVEISVEPLWRDEDLLSISSLICWDVDDFNVCAVCIKDMYIIVLIVQKNSGKLVSTHIHNTNRRNLAGLLKLDNASFLIGSQQGALFKLTLVQDDNGQLKFMNETVQNNFIRTRYGVMGLAASRNRDFVAVNLCVNGPYDHSKLKTLSSLVICSLENREIDLMTMISSNSFVNLDRIWDCLENVRLSILQKSLTYIFPSTIRCQLDTMDIHPLILTMWLTNFVAYSLQLEQMEVGIELLLLPENKSQTMTRLYEEIRLLVFSSHIFQRCTLILSSSTSSSSPSSFSLLSLRLMRKWICSGLLLNSSMDCHSTTRLTATSIVEQIDVHLRSKVGEGDSGQQAGERETCIVCGNDILSLSDFSVATCTEGHQIRRCTLSLVQIPSDYDEVLQCKRCGVLAHPQAVTGDYASCVFCNSLLAPDQELMPDSQILVLEDEHDNIGQNRRRPRTRSIVMRGKRGEESDSDDELVVPKKKSKKKAK